jgi:hypothetical protein
MDKKKSSVKSRQVGKKIHQSHSKTLAANPLYNISTITRHCPKNTLIVGRFVGWVGILALLMALLLHNVNCQALAS